MESAPGSNAAPVEVWRRLTLLLFLFGTAGTAIELLLLEHFEDPWQWAPLALLAAGTVGAGYLGLRPSRGAVLTLRALTVSYLVAAALGLYLHVESNVEFELELHPTMSGSELIVETLMGAIPALAPGAMAQLGLLGLIICFRHPALRGWAPETETPPEQEN